MHTVLTPLVSQDVTELCDIFMNSFGLEQKCKAKTSCYAVGELGVDVPGTGVDVPGTGVDVPGTGVDVAGTWADVAGTGLDVPGTGVDVAGSGVDVACIGVDVADTGVDVPGSLAVSPFENFRLYPR